MMEAPGALAGRRVLLVEDESIVSLLVEDLLLDAGCEVELAMRLNEALQLANAGQFDFAILDVNLGGGDFSFSVAATLRQRRIPFLFATGYASEGIHPDFRGIPTLQKPYQPNQLLESAARLVA